MTKPNEVLFRLHSTQPPQNLGVEVISRNDAALKELHEKLGVLPGEKILSTNLSVDRPWALDDAFGELERAGYILLNMHVEVRIVPKTNKKKPVLSVNFGLAGEATCTAEQLAWVKDFFGRTGFELAQAYLNPRRDGSSQIAYDCTSAVSLDGTWQTPLPLSELIGSSADGVIQQEQSSK